MKAFFKKYMFPILTIGIFILFTLIYYKGKAKGGFIPLPDNGTGIPAGWTAVPTVALIENNFGSIDLFTNERKIIEILSGLTRDQLAAVNNEWINQNNKTIIEDLSDHFTNPNNLAIALNYYSFLAK